MNSPSSRDIFFMKAAFEEALKALKNNDIPIGAVITKDDKIISRGYNQVEYKQNSLFHAEIIAINKAIKKIGYKHLLDCKMYINLEPCVMCAGAIVLARIPEIFISTKNLKAGAGGSVLNILTNKELNHKCKVNFGLIENESSKLIKDFFRELREAKTI